MMKCDKYIIKPEEKLVVGEMKRKTPKNVTQECLDKNETLYSLFLDLHIKGIIEDVSDMKQPFKGVAKCQNEDDFSEKTGKKIADMKVGYKYHMSMYKKYKQLLSIIRDIECDVMDLKDSHIEKAIKLDEKLAEFL